MTDAKWKINLSEGKEINDLTLREMRRPCDDVEETQSVKLCGREADRLVPPTGMSFDFMGAEWKLSVVSVWDGEDKRKHGGRKMLINTFISVWSTWFLNTSSPQFLDFQHLGFSYTEFL